MLSVHEVTTAYQGLVAISAVSIEVEKGEIVCVAGANGAGKSTLLKSIAGAERPRSGTVTFDGKRIDGMAQHHITATGIAYVPENRRLFPRLSVRDNLRLGLLSDKDIEALFEQVGSWFPVLTKRLNQRAGTLSGGEQKMLIVARALMAKPDVLLLDEVTEGLQPSVVDRLSEVLVRVRREIGTSMIVVEQHLPFALSISDRYLVFKRGEIVDAAVVDAGAAARIDAHMRI